LRITKAKHVIDESHINVLQADETEVYTVRELLRDIQGCAARRVLLVVDQSYSGEIVRAVHSHATSNNLANVLVFTSSSSSQPAWQGDFTAHWSRASHRQSCLQEVFQVRI
jgi:hypothetical protein